MLSIDEQYNIIRGPYQLSLDITNNCNYRCLHCYNSSGENNTANCEMTDTQIINLIKEIAEIKPFGICFCGGEPLLKLELILKCSDILYEGGVKNISMVSNGYFMTEEVVKRLKEHHVSHIQISLDGANSETCFDLRQNNKAFEKAINALKIVTEAGNLSPSVAFCPTKNNIEQFEEVCDICESIGVSTLRVQPLMIIGRANKNLEKIIPSNLQYIELVRKIRKMQIKYATKDLYIEYGDPLNHIFVAKEKKFNFTSYSFSIRADGSIAVSPYLPITVGNVKRHSIKEYWNANFYKVWNLDVVQKLAKNLNCVENMGAHGNLETWIDKNIEIDIIDDHVFED